MSEPDYLVDMLVLLAVAVFTVPMFQRLHLGGSVLSTNGGAEVYDPGVV